MVNTITPTELISIIESEEEMLLIELDKVKARKQQILKQLQKLDDRKKSIINYMNEDSINE